MTPFSHKALRLSVCVALSRLILLCKVKTRARKPKVDPELVWMLVGSNTGLQPATIGEVAVHMQPLTNLRLLSIRCSAGVCVYCIPPT